MQRCTYGGDTNKLVHSFLYFCRAQGDLYRVQHKFEGAQQEVDRLSADLEKSNYMASKHKDEHKNVTDELHALQEEFDESSLQLSRYLKYF